MSTVRKKNLVSRVAVETKTRESQAKAIVQCFLDEIIAELAKGNRLEFRDFGVFEVRERAPRMAQNPKTLEPVQVPATRTVKFKMGQLMVHKVNGRSQDQ